MSADWFRVPPPVPDAGCAAAAAARQLILTKPKGALGRLEDLAIHLSAMQGTALPSANRIHISVFAADHGIAEENVSAFPQGVTLEMVKNFAAGGAAINVLAEENGATLEIVDVGTAAANAPPDGVIDARIAPGTENFVCGPAMSAADCLAALSIGRASVKRALENGADLFIGGEMGIGNTTSAAAIASALLDKPVASLAGPGTGLDNKGMARKIALIERALVSHRGYFGDPLEVLRRIGGFEIAALAGSFVAAAQAKLPVVVDGFIAGVAALVANRIGPGSGEWFLFSHRSAEPGHRIVLEALGANPLLDLGMRLGEGSGAALAVPIIRAACALHGRMATFSDAGVSGAIKDNSA